MEPDRPTVRLLDYIEDRVQIGDDCWEWTGSHLKAGYGAGSVAGKHFLAHRMIYELLVGPIPDGLEIDHLCRNRGCVNPGHMEPVTHRENLMRGDTVAAANPAKTHCIRGHPYDDENTYRYGSHRYCRACNKASHAV